MTFEEYLDGVSHLEAGVPVTRRNAWSDTRIQFARSVWGDAQAAMVNKGQGMGLAAMAYMTCFAGATFLAYHGKDGWGWLIFAGIMIGSAAVRVD